MARALTDPQAVGSLDGRQAAPFTVLLVCTGNICRSALAERLGRAYLDEALADASGDVRLISAGTQAVVGSGMHPDSALVLLGFGGEAADFRAQQLTAEHPGAADLVLTMTRAHRKHVLAVAPRALARTFTVREAADLLGRMDHLAVTGDDFVSRARGLVEALAAERAYRQSGADDDVPDPIGGPIDAHEQAAELIVAALLPVLSTVAALHPSTSARTPAPAGATSR